MVGVYSTERGKNGTEEDNHDSPNERDAPAPRARHEPTVFCQDSGADGRRAYWGHVIGNEVEVDDVFVLAERIVEAIDELENIR